MMSRWVVALSIAGLASCTAEIGDNPNPDNTAAPGEANKGGASAGATAAPSGPRAAVCAAGETNKPGYRMVRRLSQGEYNRTLRDVFGLDAATWQDIQFPGEITRKGAYENFSDALEVNQPFMATLADKTFERASALLTGPKAAGILAAPCSPAQIDAVCAESVVRRYAGRLFRRPVTDAEVTDYVGLFKQATTELMMSGTDALAGTLSALMQSPKTLYIEQLGSADGSSYRLGAYEVASVMAYGLTGSVPSQTLLDVAGKGALDSESGIANQVRAMLASPLGQAHTADFFQAWLGYDRVPFVAKDPATYTFTPELSGAMVQEAKLLVDSTFQKGGGLAQLLTAPQTYVNKTLALHYGWPAEGLTDALIERQRPQGQGIGLLAQGAFLTRLAASNSSSPTQRGAFILRSMMCRELGQPPPVVPNIVPPSGEVTTRERYEKVHGVSGCTACHGRMDPVGFGLENFDGVGKFRTTEVGKAIDASGVVEDLDGLKFNGPEDLAHKLAASPELGQCLAAQLTSYIFGVSVQDGLCMTPQTTYAAGSLHAFKDVVEQVATAAELTRRTP
jgi:hypothetical protein